MSITAMRTTTIMSVMLTTITITIMTMTTIIMATGMGITTTLPPISATGAI
jgi:hypothetical protein